MGGLGSYVIEPVAKRLSLWETLKLYVFDYQCPLDYHVCVFGMSSASTSSNTYICIQDIEFSTYASLFSQGQTLDFSSLLRTRRNFCPLLAGKYQSLRQCRGKHMSEPWVARRSFLPFRDVSASSDYAGEIRCRLQGVH